MLGVSVVSGNENTLVRDADAVLGGEGRGSPLEIKDIVSDVVPFFTDILGVVQLLVDSAWFVHELSTGSPGGGKSPRPLGGMEHELVNLLARVEGLDVGSAVVRDPVDSLSA